MDLLLPPQHRERVRGLQNLQLRLTVPRSLSRLKYSLQKKRQSQLVALPVRVYVPVLDSTGQAEIAQSILETRRENECHAGESLCRFRQSTPGRTVGTDHYPVQGLLA